jgi:hypothetical protein
MWFFGLSLDLCAPVRGTFKQKTPKNKRRRHCIILAAVFLISPFVRCVCVFITPPLGLPPFSIRHLIEGWVEGISACVE